MIVQQRVLFLAIVSASLASQSAVAGELIGKRVMPISDAVTLRGEGGANAKIHSIQWPASVKTIDGQWLWVQDDGGTAYPIVGGWVRGEDVVLVHEALDYYNSRLQQEAGVRGIYWLRGVCWENAREFDLATKDYEQAVQQDAQNPQARLGLARMLSRKEYNDEQFVEAWKLNRASPRLHVDWGQALEVANMAGRAEAMYQEAARLNPHWRTPPHALGKLAASRGDFTTALENYAEAIRRDASFHVAHRDRASAWLAAKQGDASHLAVGSARKACELCYFREADSLAVLAESHAALKQWPEARRYQQMAVEYSPMPLKEKHKSRYVDYATKVALEDNLLASGERTRDVELIPPDEMPRVKPPQPVVRLPLFLDRSSQSFE